MGSENGLNDLLLVFSEMAVHSLKLSRDYKRGGLTLQSRYHYGEYVAYYQVCNTLRRLINAGKEGGETE